MARPAKSIDTQSRHNTPTEIKTRKVVEEQLKGNADKLIPPDYFNENQEKIFYNIVGELKASGILGNLDIYILTTCTIAIDRLFLIEEMINNNPELLMSTSIMGSKDKYTKDLFRCCNELSLSPQSRAKIGSIALQKSKEKDDIVLSILQGGKVDE